MVVCPHQAQFCLGLPHVNGIECGRFGEFRESNLINIKEPNLV